MAGEWIKMRTNLWDDPRVSQLCDLTGVAEAMIVGGLYWLWSTADEHTETGLLPGMSMGAIDRKTGIKGFGGALVTVGWIQDTIDGVLIERFEEHNGTSAKQRVQTAKRVAKSRGNGDVTLASLPSNASTVTGALAREEKIRGEVKESPIPPGGGEPKPVKKTRAAIEFKTFLAECKRDGVKPIPETDSVFDYAQQAGISDDMLALQWSEFRARYSLPNSKKYKAWAVVFGKSVRGNWFRLWRFDTNGECVLTTEGIQAKNAVEAARRKAA